MIIEIVDFPIENGDFPVRYVNVYQRVWMLNIPVKFLDFATKNGGSPYHILHPEKSEIFLPMKKILAAG